MIEWDKTDGWFRRVAEREEGTLAVGAESFSAFLDMKLAEQEAKETQSSVPKQKKAEKIREQ